MVILINTVLLVSFLVKNIIRERSFKAMWVYVMMVFVCLSVNKMLKFFCIELYSASIGHSLFYFRDKTDMDDDYILRGQCYA